MAAEMLMVLGLEGLESTVPMDSQEGRAGTHTGQVCAALSTGHVLPGGHSTLDVRALLKGGSYAEMLRVVFRGHVRRRTRVPAPQGAWCSSSKHTAHPQTPGCERLRFPQNSAPARHPP